MSLWYDKKGKTYASKGSSSWVKLYAEHLVNALTARLEGHYKGAEGKHRAEDVLVDGVGSVADVLGNKVDKIPGKGLSQQDFTAAEKEKLAGISENATAVGKVLSPTGAEAFNDPENTANIPYAHVEGRNNHATVRGFYITSYSANTVTLDSVKGIEVGMPWYIFLDTPEKQERYAGYVEKIVGNTLTVTSGEMPTGFVPSKTPSYFGTFLVNVGDIGSFEVADTSGEFNVHLEGKDNKAFLNAHAEGTGVIAGYSSHAEGRKTKAVGQCSHAEGYGGSALASGAHVEGASCKAKGYYSHAEGYYTETEGNFSHAEGQETNAIGVASHAEGYDTTASTYAHAEGNTTTASGEGSHAEGNHTEASGRHSHSEGSGTKAQGVRSHAEGDDTIAFGECAHAEGKGTIANGQYSHAEGYGTIANGKHQHVQGTYNVVDDNNVYVHIVGNGSASMSSNAYTLDWDGNGRYSGDVYAKGELVATKRYVDESVAEAGGGDMLRNVYDQDRTGIVDDAERLGGQLPDYYAKQSDLDNKPIEKGSGLSSAIIWDEEGYQLGGVTLRPRATGNGSFAAGFETIASGKASAAFGDGTEATGIYSFSTGEFTYADGYASFATGTNNVAGNYQTVVGKLSKGCAGATGAQDSTGSAFVVGIGDTKALANGFRVTNDGYCYGQNAFAASGADYAEYFEWADQNPTCEDRRGYFVTLEGGKIRKATSRDTYLLGIVSATPVIEGNAYADQWQGMYQTDIFGQRLTETVEVPETTDERTGRIIPAHTETRFLLNPDYDATQEYLGRNERPEWSPVGLVGQLVAVDDGSCEIDGFCKVAEGGMGTKSDTPTPYRVMERLDDSHVRLFVK